MGPLPPEAEGNTTAALAVVAARLTDLREDVKGLRGDVARSAEAMVTRGEWLMFQQEQDRRFREQGREIGELRTEQRAKRLPWTQVATAVVAVAGLTLTILR